MVSGCPKGYFYKGFGKTTSVATDEFGIHWWPLVQDQRWARLPSRRIGGRRGSKKTHTHTHHTHIHTHNTHTHHTHTPHTHHTHTHHTHITHTYTHIHTPPPPPPPHTHTHTHTSHTHTHHTHITHTHTPHTHHTHTYTHTNTHTSHTHTQHTHTHTHTTHTHKHTHTQTAAFCVAGVALGDIHFRYAWQKVTSTVVLCGRRGTDGTGWRAWTGLGAAVTPVTPRHSAWQAWHLVTSTLISRGRRGTTSHLPSFCVAGVGQMALGGALGTGLGAAVTPVTPRHFCVAGVALGNIHLDFTWQAWHNLTSTVVLPGRRGTDGTGWRAWTGLGAAVTPVTPRHFCVAGVALGDIHLDFTWQAWHNLTSTVVLRGRRAWQAWHLVTSTLISRGRRGTTSHLPSFCVAGVRGRRGTW